MNALAPNIKAYFGKEIRPQIIEHLKNAHKQVHIAVSWFNDDDIFECLSSLLKEGIILNIVITKDEERNTLAYEALQENGAQLYQLDQEKALMHHKFCVVDGQTVITGSYNWTHGADKKNMENVVIIQNHQKLAQDFIAEYEKIIKAIEDHLQDQILLLLQNKDDHIKKVEEHTERIRTYINTYKKLPPKELFEKGDSSSGDQKAPADLSNKLPVKDSGLNQLDFSYEEMKSWWDSLSEEWKFILCKKVFGMNHKNYSLELDRDALENIFFIQSLNISGKTIDEPFPPITQLKNLTYLNISGCGLSKIQFVSQLPKLIGLTCVNNRLTSLRGIENLNYLQYLDIDKAIGNLPLEREMLAKLGFKRNANNLSFWSKSI